MGGAAESGRGTERRLAASAPPEGELTVIATRRYPPGPTLSVYQGTGVELKCAQGVLRSMMNHARKGLSQRDGGTVPGPAVETKGFLLGRVESRDGRCFIAIERSVELPIRPEDRGDAAFFAAADWARVERELRKYPGGQVIGDYHSHPNHAVRLSEPDATHLNQSHPEPYQVAAIVGPREGSNGIVGFFVKQVTNGTARFSPGQAPVAEIPFDQEGFPSSNRSRRSPRLPHQLGQLLKTGGMVPKLAATALVAIFVVAVAKIQDANHGAQQQIAKASDRGAQAFDAISDSDQSAGGAQAQGNSAPPPDVVSATPVGRGTDSIVSQAWAFEGIAFDAGVAIVTIVTQEPSEQRAAGRATISSSTTGAATVEVEFDEVIVDSKFQVRLELAELPPGDLFLDVKSVGAQGESPIQRSATHTLRIATLDNLELVRSEDGDFAVAVPDQVGSLIYEVRAVRIEKEWDQWEQVDGRSGVVRVDEPFESLPDSGWRRLEVDVEYFSSEGPRRRTFTWAHSEHAYLESQGEVGRALLKEEPAYFEARRLGDLGEFKAPLKNLWDLDRSGSHVFVRLASPNAVDKQWDQICQDYGEVLNDLGDLAWEYGPAVIGDGSSVPASHHDKVRLVLLLRDGFDPGEQNGELAHRIFESPREGLPPLNQALAGVNGPKEFYIRAASSQKVAPESVHDAGVLRSPN